MAAVMETDPPVTELFRPIKRRKFVRRKADPEADEDESTKDAIAPVAAPEPATIDELISQGGDSIPSIPTIPQEVKLSVQDLIRQRKVAQRRKAGIEFSNHHAASPAPQNAQQLITKEEVEEEEEVPEDIKSVVSRFAPQTGQVTDDTDKHMYVSPSVW